MNSAMRDVSDVVLVWIGTAICYLVWGNSAFKTLYVTPSQSEILRWSSFQKYTTCWVFHAFCHMLYLCILYFCICAFDTWEYLLISLNNPFFKNISHVGSFWRFVICCISVFVYFVCVFFVFVRLTLGKVIFDILEQSSFQKYGTCWVFFRLHHMLYLCICVFVHLNICIFVFACLTHGNAIFDILEQSSFSKICHTSGVSGTWSYAVFFMCVFLFLYLHVWHMWILFLIALNNPLFKNIPHVESIWHFVICCICVFVYLCMCILYLPVWHMGI